MSSRDAEKTGAAIGCTLMIVYALVIIAFWVAVGYIVLHFVFKYW